MTNLGTGAGERAKPVSRIIYLDGVDTGLRAWTKNDAVATMLRVLRRRGNYTINEESLQRAYSTSRQRIDFALSPESP